MGNILACMAAVLVLGLAMPGGARADDASDRLQCQDRDAQPDIRIGACSRLIQSGLYKNTDLGVIFNKRGIAFYKQRQYDHAIEDYSQAMASTPMMPWPSTTGGWLTD